MVALSLWASYGHILSPVSRGSQWLLCIDSLPSHPAMEQNYFMWFCFFNIYYIYLYMHDTVHVWRRSEDNFRESVLSFHSMGTEVLKSGHLAWP